MIVVKIGGKVVEDTVQLEAFCKDFSQLQGPKILVHGGGVMASEIQKALGQEPLMVEGRRVTDEQTLKVVTMVYAGWCNKTIVAKLQALGCNAIGLSGCDASSINATKREPKTLLDGVTKQDYGFVGDLSPESINTENILKLLDAGFTPVFCAINHDSNGQLLNTNADTVACAISSAFNAKLLYCFEKNGVLCNPNDDSTVIPLITPGLFEQLVAQGKVVSGMIPKIENSFSALRQGTSEVIIKNAASLLQDSGTKLKLK